MPEVKRLAVSNGFLFHTHTIVFVISSVIATFSFGAIYLLMLHFTFQEEKKGIKISTTTRGMTEETLSFIKIVLLYIAHTSLKYQQGFRKH